MGGNGYSSMESLGSANVPPTRKLMAPPMGNIDPVVFCLVFMQLCSLLGVEVVHYRR